MVGWSWNVVTVPRWEHIRQWRYSLLRVWRLHTDVPVIDSLHGCVRYWFPGLFRSVSGHVAGRRASDVAGLDRAGDPILSSAQCKLNCG